MCTREEFDQTYAVLEQMCGVGILPVDEHTQLVRGICNNLTDIEALVEVRRLEGLKAVQELQDRYARLSGKQETLENHPVRGQVAATEEELFKQRDQLGDVQSNAASRRAYLLKQREQQATEPEVEATGTDHDLLIAQSQLQFYQTQFPVMFSACEDDIVEGQIYQEKTEEFIPFRLKKDISAVQELWDIQYQGTEMS